MPGLLSKAKRLVPYSSEGRGAETFDFPELDPRLVDEEGNCWIETSNTHEDGTPATRRIKMPLMGEKVLFTEKGYSKVSANIAKILLRDLDSIEVVEEPDAPGEYYDESGTLPTDTDDLCEQQQELQEFVEELRDVDSALYHGSAYRERMMIADQLEELINDE